MQPKMKWVLNTMPKGDDGALSIMSRENIDKARAFHASFPQYEPTPLANLANMARHLGVKGLFVKDESYRFGLNAFKALGGSFAIANYIAEQVGKNVSDCDYGYLTSPQALEDLGPVTFFTATDGNHGRGVAWAARKLNQKAVVRMPRGTKEARLKNIEAEGAEVTIEDLVYDDCVRLAARQAAECDRGVLVQDTAWDGYEKVPSWIMQGYGTMVAEAVDQLRAAGVERPSHVFVQAGVGSLAGEVIGCFASLYPDNPPTCVVLEPHAANCHYQSALAGDGEPRACEGDMLTIMAGLACGEPSTVSWAVMRNHANAFVSCADEVSALGMRMLAAPMKGDPQVVSGESGAVGMGVLASIMLDDDYAELRDALGLGADSQVTLFSTEGDTDPQGYRDIVWGER